jgi:heme exporter protein CcmD
MILDEHALYIIASYLAAFVILGGVIALSIRAHRAAQKP